MTGVSVLRVFSDPDGRGGNALGVILDGGGSNFYGGNPTLGNFTTFSAVNEITTVTAGGSLNLRNGRSLGSESIHT